MNGNKAIIKVVDLKKHYDGGKVKALDGITTEIDRGEVVVIIGPSGSGKSTMLRSLNLLEIPTSGHIFVDGTDIVLRKYQKSCIFCGESDGLVEFGGKVVCADCLKKIKKL